MKTVNQAQKTSLNSEGLVRLAASTLVANKGQDVLILNVRGLSSLWDFFIICSGSSKRHVQALAQHLQEALGQVGVKPLGVEGQEEGNWILLDYVDVVIHLFLKPLRDFYDLEGLWVDAGRLSEKDFALDQTQEQPPA
jgi:ribosome-associated protein